MPFWSSPKISLRQRLSLGLGTMLMPLLLLAVGALFSFENALDSFQRQDNVGREELFPLAELEGQILEIAVVASADESNLMTPEEYQLKQQIIENHLTMLLEFSQEKPAQYNAVREIQRDWQQIATLCQRIIAPVDPQPLTNSRELKDQLRQQLKTTLQEIQQLNYRLIAFQNDANLVHAELVRAQVRQLVTLISLLALGLAVLFAYTLSQSITAPLQSLEAGVEKLSMGDLSHRIVLETEDEFGHLAEMFNLMALKLERSQKDLSRLATLDELTEVYNRREFNRLLAVEIERSQRNNQIVSLIMLDIDHFKQLNDTFGHQAGDLALYEVAQRLKREVRPGDIVCRYGGEEFAIILPAATRTDSMAIAERIRAAVVQQPIILPSQQCIEMTASLGVAAFPEHATTKEHLIKKADQALYTAKHSGRNRVHQSRRTGVSEKDVA